MLTRLRIFRFVLVLILYSSNSPLKATEFQAIATVTDQRIDEASGMAASRTHPGAFWIHNDSGDKPRLFLVGLDGMTIGVVNIDDAQAHDWEDMCSFRMNSQSWLLIGDIGDNGRKRGRKKQPPCVLYLLREPKIPQSNGQPTVRWPVAARLEFSYDDGPHNCEGVAVDVERKEILVLTKSRPDECGLYRLPLDIVTPRQTLVAERIASPFLPFITSIDIHHDGRTMAICSIGDGLIVTRGVQESWADAINRGGQPLPLPQRRQGETICFSADGKSLYAHSEHKSQPLWRRAWQSE